MSEQTVEDSQSGKVLVTFQVSQHIWADVVHLVGDFNNWNPTSLPMHHTPHNGWELTIALEKGRAYQYRYLLDGKYWLNDCNADGYAPNPFGGENSVVYT